jgi:STE24 endopeptidase
MPTLALVIAAVLVFRFALETWVEILNLRATAAGTLPSEFGAIYDAKRYTQALAYQRETTRFGLWQGAFDLALLLAFWALGGFGVMDAWARGFGFGPVATGLVFVGAISLLKMIVMLPWAVYSTFVLEERYGFNRTTWRTFVGDRLKGLVLGALLGALIFGAILWFFGSFGANAWIYAWAAVTVLQLVLLYLAPVLLMPLFNKFNPLPPGELRRDIEAYAQQENFQLSGMFTMDGSKRSSKANAFFTGFGRFRKLVLFDTLIEKQTPEELTAVVAHEIGHFKLGHIPRTVALSFASTALIFWSFHFFFETNGESSGGTVLAQAFGIPQGSVYATIFLLGIVYGPILRLTSFFTQWLSRKHEYEADEFSARTYRKPEALISALKKLSAENLSTLTPHPWKVLLDYTHPPVMKRVAALRLSKS